MNRQPGKKKTYIVLELAVILVLIISVICSLIYFGVLDNPLGKDRENVSESSDYEDGSSDEKERTEPSEYEDESSDKETEEDSPEMLTVPNVISETREDAIAKLRNAGFQAPVVKEVYDENTPEGYVIATSLDAGEEIAEGITVVVYVSLGAEPIDLPDVAGSDEASATEVLVALGMPVKVIYNHSDDVPEGCVIRQQPAAGTAQIKGTAVTIYVSLGKENHVSNESEGTVVSYKGDYWVRSNGIAYYVPAGFGEVQAGDAACTISQELYNPELGMTITIRGYTTSELGKSPLDQIAMDLDNFDTSGRSITYESDDNDWFVKSGYIIATDEIYYTKEFISMDDPDLLIRLEFIYSTESKSQCDSVLETFLDNFK